MTATSLQHAKFITLLAFVLLTFQFFLLFLSRFPTLFLLAFLPVYRNSYMAETSWKEQQIELDEKEVNVIYVPQKIQDAITHGLTDGYEFNTDQIKFEECPSDS